jgi:hypothetical protein
VQEVRLEGHSSRSRWGGVEFSNGDPEKDYTAAFEEDVALSVVGVPGEALLELLFEMPRTFGPGDVHGALRDFKFAALAEGAFFSSHGLRQMFAKYYFNNPTHVTLSKSSKASCLGILNTF